jgi:putative MATE family efflux protein
MASAPDPPSTSLVLGDHPTWRVVLALAWPVLLQQMLVFAVQLSDALLAGRFRPLEGDQLASQAAQTSATYLSWVIASYTIFVSVGSTALVARFVGAGDRQAAVHATNQSLLLGVLFGLAASVAGLVWVHDLVRLLGLHGEAADFAAAYLRPQFALLIFQVVESAGVACLIGAGDTRSGMWILSLVAVVNVPLAWGFHHGWGPLPELGFPGISLGTAVSHVLGAGLVLAVLARGRAGLHLRTELLWPDLPLMRRLLRISVPAGVDSLSVALGQLWFLSVVNRLGVVDASAHGIALRCEAISFLAGNAFGVAAMTLVGQNLGAGRPDRAARSAWTAFGLGCAVMCLCGALFYLLAPQLFELFCPFEEQRPAIALGVPVLRLIAFAMPPLASAIVFTASLRGAGDTRVPVLFSLTGFFAVRVPLAYWLTGPAMGLGLLGAWVAMSIDVLVRGLFLMLRFAGGRWKRIEV